MRLRDIELRWSEDAAAPEAFMKRCPVEYVFYRELRALKIETPGIAKINVYCEPRAMPYKGCVHDGVTAVHLKCGWEAIEPLPPRDMVRPLAALLTEGTKTVLSRFKIDVRDIDEIAPKLEAGAVWTPINIGKSATRSPDGRCSARLSVRSADSLQHAIVSITIMRGRTKLGEIPICTTFPSHDYALDDFRSLEWLSHGRLKATFALYGSPDHRVFGRRNFDSSDFAHVQAADSADRRHRSFTIDVSVLTKPA